MHSDSVTGCATPRIPRLLTRVEGGKLVGVPGWLVNLYLKLGPHQWLSCFGHEAELESATQAALAQWAGFSDKAPSPKSGYFLTEDAFPALNGMLLGAELD